MKVKMFTAFALLVVSAAILQLNCASTTGFVIGSAKDASKPDSLYLPGWKAEAVKPGTNVNLFLTDGSPVTGIYRGLGQVANEEYAERYSRFRKHKQDLLFLPALGETITITMQSGAQLEREFLGFNYQRLAEILDAKTIADLEAPSLAILVRQLVSNTSGTLFMKNVVKVADVQGNSTEGAILLSLAAENEIPLHSTIIVEKPDRHVQFPMDKVERVELKNKKKARWTGLAIGAIIDVAAWVSAYAWKKAWE
jgi:hypothetical protein